MEQAPNAISHASSLCSEVSDHVTFTRANAVRFKPERRSDLVWSGGLFDYFEDRLFGSVLKRLYSALVPGGELVIGNFSTGNPTRRFMNFMDWFLCYRDARQLVNLAELCGMRREQISVGEEPEHINLFLHVRA